MTKIKTFARKFRQEMLLFCLLSALLLVVVSCTHENLVEGDTLSGNQVALNVSVADSNTKATGSVLAGESKVEDIAVWLYDDNFCLSYHYFRAADQTASEQAKWAEGTFKVTLANVLQRESIRYIQVIANTAHLIGGVPDAAQQINKEIGWVRRILTTRAYSAISPIVSPLPMSSLFMEILPNQSIIPIDLCRSIARVNVSVTVDDTYLPGLKGRLDLSKAQATLHNLVEHGICNYNQHDITGESIPTDCDKYIDDNTSVRLYSTNPRPLTPSVTDSLVSIATPFYLNQRAFETFPSEDSAPDHATTLALQVPYKDESGNWVDDNHYKVRIGNINPIVPFLLYSIAPNRSYNLKLTLIGLGAEGIKAEIDCLPWNVEDKEMEAGVDFTLSNDKVYAYSTEPIVNQVAVLIKSVFGSTESIGTIQSSNPAITLHKTTFDTNSINEEVRISMPSKEKGTLTFTLDGKSKIVTINESVTGPGPEFTPITIYSVPEVCDIPAGTTKVQVFDGNDWLEATNARTIELRTTKFCIGTDKPATVLVHVGSNGSMYYLTRKKIEVKFGFEGCNRQMSREAERWDITLTGGVFKKKTQINARLIEDRSKESLSAKDIDAVISIDPLVGSGTGAYTKKRWGDFQNGQSYTRLEVKLPGSSSWETTSEKGLMHDRNTWISHRSYQHLFGRGKYITSSNVLQFVIAPIEHSYFEVHENHPYFGKGNWALPTPNADSGLENPIYEIWVRSTSGVTQNIYGQDFSKCGKIITAEYDDKRCVALSPRSVNPNYGSSNDWYDFTRRETVIGVPTKGYVIRPTDDDPITK